MSLTAWFLCLWTIYTLVVVWLIIIQPNTKNLAAEPVELVSDDEVDVTLISPR